MKYFQASSFLPAGEYPWLKEQDRLNKTTYTEKNIYTEKDRFKFAK